jgi:hypothetical protein
MNGDLEIRGRQSKSVDYADIRRDFWRSAYIDIQPDNASLWKASILPLEGAKIPDYDGLIVDRNSVEMLWPRHEWKYDWRTVILGIKSKLKSWPVLMSEIEKKEPAPELSETIDAALPVADDASQELALVTVTPTSAAPQDWERLFAVGDDGNSIWLRFLPDTKDEKADALLLVVYANKVLLNKARVPIQAAYNAVQKSIDVAPARSYVPQTVLTRWSLAMSGLSALAEVDYAAKLLGSSLRRVGLSQGGMFEITENGEERAARLAYDLIQRA